jgi:hypothetical protein
MTTITSKFKEHLGGSVTVQKEEDYSMADVYLKTDDYGASLSKADAKKVVQAIANAAGFNVKIGD